MREFAQKLKPPQQTTSAKFSNPKPEFLRQSTEISTPYIAPQTKHSSSGHIKPFDVPPIVKEVLSTPGQPLDTKTRKIMERRFGHDFSRVKVHSDSKSAESAQVINARAYTLGQDMVFGANQYRPGNTAGKRLIAHELTHILQQGNIPQKLFENLALSSRFSPFECEARHIANSLMRYDSQAVAEHVSKIAEKNQVRSIRVGEGNTIQRDDVCEPDQVVHPTEPEVIYDYENQVCRPAESEEAGAIAPEVSTVDGEFWMIPEGVREGARPIFDDEDTNVVVAFRYSSGGYYEVYDLEGNFVESGEPGLESPLIDPIDILAGGLTGLGRGLLGGGTRFAARGAGVAIGGAGLRVGLRSAVRILSRRALTAVRGVYRGIRFRGLLNFTATTAAHMADPARRVPHHILKLAIHFGRRSLDPQGVRGTFQYVIPMFRNGQQYTLTVVIREADQTILHFLYR
jgi:hypothetical protein